MPYPVGQKIYHIVHVDRLASIVRDHSLWSHSEAIRRQLGGTMIGMDQIKRNRLNFPVKCWPGDTVGSYVPFYFCSRSIMLFVIHCANHPGLTYRGGQGPIVHLEADLAEVITAANAADRRWAVSLSNAGTAYSEFRTGPAAFDEIDWDSVRSTQFRDPDIKERKQAEFLIQRSFPWTRISKIGVQNQQIAQQVANILHNVDHRPAVEIRPDWYY
ncbi:type II toxin-antitoxin system toxin DNA ADP-ribosyl transferase DarT [Caulobacter sp. LjRoot300]|uniref:type II toxin-antitoxin system toxin DNA ADP-ribosyl transferase DarT n=1 Tax=Caulobacter sp. LjRoot300 TaxID=3342321 RepID=UPI003ECFA5B6